MQENFFLLSNKKATLKLYIIKRWIIALKNLENNWNETKWTMTKKIQKKERVVRWLKFLGFAKNK